jgi:hypothetical protein
MRIDLKTVGSQITSSGLTHVEGLADKQAGPTCGFEAVENIIQLFRGNNSTLSERWLIPRAQQYGFALPGPGGLLLAISGYQTLLSEFGITSQWYPVDHQQVFLPALKQNRPILPIGEGFRLNPFLYSAPGFLHAIVLTNYFTNDSEAEVLGYVGLDSHIVSREVSWWLSNIHESAMSAGASIGHGPALITDMPATWTSHAKYYRTRSDKLEPVY